MNFQQKRHKRKLDSAKIPGQVSSSRQPKKFLKINRTLSISNQKFKISVVESLMTGLTIFSLTSARLKPLRKEINSESDSD